MFGLFAAGLRWTDEAREPRPAPVLGRAPTGVTRRIAAVLAASWLLVAAWPVAAAWIELRVDARAIQIEAIVPRGGWQVGATATGDWIPELVAPTAVDVQTFIDGGRTVGVYRGVYRGQRQGSELVNALNQIVGSESKRWRLIDGGTLKVRLNGESTLIRTAVVRGTTGRFLIWHWYWLAGEATSSDVFLKVQLAWQRLSGASDTGAWVAIYTPVGDDIRAGVQTLTSFVEAMSGPIDAALETTASR